MPGPGGILDQDAYIMMGVHAVLDAIAEKQNKEDNKKIVEAEHQQNRMR